ncbi:hypothetical protein JCM11251_003386 [Rhodosporidiobolus azoricus]
MGVHGLTSYIRKNTNLGTLVDLPAQREVEPIPLIVDGLSFLYGVGLIDPFRGGNYATVRGNVRRYVEFWRACGLEPEFVWDGPFDSNKLPTVISRSSQSLGRWITYMRASDSARGNNATLRNQASRLPPLTHMAVSAELEALGVPSHCAEEEGDSPTAELAQRRNGFVVSNDSDYFIYNARCRGYAPLTSIEYGLSNSDRLDLVPPTDPPSMRLRVFQHEDVARHFALPPAHLPILGALIGNDLSDYSSDIRLAPPKFPGQMPAKEITRISRALVALSAMPASTHAEVQDIVFLALQSLLRRPSSDPMIVASLGLSAFGYALRPLEAPSPTYPLQPFSLDSPTAALSRSLYNTAYKASHLSSFFLHILKHGVVVIQGSVEDPAFQSPMIQLGRPLRLWVYAVLQDALGGRLPYGARVVEYVRRQDELYPAEVDVPLLGNLVAATGGANASSYFTSSCPAVLAPSSDRLSLFLLALHYPSLPPAPDSSLAHFLPLVLALRHIQRFSKRPWTRHEILSGILPAVLLRTTAGPAALLPFTRSRSDPLPFVPPKPYIQRSVELVQTLVFVNLLAQSLLLGRGQVDAQGGTGVLTPPHELFDGAGLHAFLQRGQRGMDRLLREVVSAEVTHTVAELEQLIILQ